MNILVRAPNWIGDQVLAFPFFYYLRQAFPKAKITSVCVDWVADIQFTTLVDEVVVLPRATGPGFFRRFAALEEGAKKLKSLSVAWDLGISLPNSFSAAWLMYRAGVKQRRGYQTEGRSFLLTDKVAWNADPSRHRSQAYVDLLPLQAQPKRPIREFWGVYPENDLDSKIPGELDRFAVEKYWANVKPLAIPDSPYWIVAPGATAESRRWPLDFFVNLIRTVHEEKKWKTVIVGGPAEAPLVAQISNRLGFEVLNYTAKGPVSSLSKLFQNAKFALTNESGLSHVAALCGCQTQIVCGAADPRRTKPLGPAKVSVIVNPVECWPCEKNTCFQTAEKKIQCLRGILPEQVWQEIKSGFDL